MNKFYTIRQVASEICYSKAQTLNYIRSFHIPRYGSLRSSKIFHKDLNYLKECIEWKHKHKVRAFDVQRLGKEKLKNLVKKDMADFQVIRSDRPEHKAMFDGQKLAKAVAKMYQVSIDKGCEDDMIEVLHKLGIDLTKYTE